MVRHAPIHRRSDHSDIAICCGRNVRGSSLSTSVVPLSNQVTTLNHKRFKGFKMFSDGHLVPGQRKSRRVLRRAWIVVAIVFAILVIANYYSTSRPELEVRYGGLNKPFISKHGA